MRLTRRVAAILTLFWNGVSADWRRIAYLTLTLGITVGAWLALSAMAAPFVGGFDAEGSGVTIRNGSQSNAALPLRYARRIRTTTGARDVTWFTFQIVTCKTSPVVQITLNAYGGPGTSGVLAHLDTEPAAKKRWAADPLGILVSDKTATDCGWRVGEGVQPPSVMGGTPLPLHIVGTVHASRNDIAYAHYDYINRNGTLFGKDKALYFLANAGSVRDDELLAARIEAEFAHDFPTVSATTNATVQNAWARFGKVQQLLAFVMSAVLLCTASVLISVLAHLTMQRRAQFALLQVIGFRRGQLFGALVLEVVLIATLGTLLGIGLGQLVTHALAPTRIGVLLGGFAIPGRAYVWMPLWLFALFVAALAWPGVILMRVRPSDYRTI